MNENNHLCCCVLVFFNPYTISSDYYPEAKTVAVQIYGNYL